MELNDDEAVDEESMAVDDDSLLVQSTQNTPSPSLLRSPFSQDELDRRTLDHLGLKSIPFRSVDSITWTRLLGPGYPGLLIKDRKQLLKKMTAIVNTEVRFINFIASNTTILMYHS